MSILNKYICICVKGLGAGKTVNFVTFAFSSILQGIWSQNSSRSGRPCVKILFYLIDTMSFLILFTQAGRVCTGVSAHRHPPRHPPLLKSTRSPPPGPPTYPLPPCYTHSTPRRPPAGPLHACTILFWITLRSKLQTRVSWQLSLTQMWPISPFFPTPYNMHIRVHV